MIRPTANQTEMLNRSDSVFAALAMLFRAYRYAVESGRELWEFSIEVSEFHSTGISTSDLRWLLVQGYVQHAVELTSPVQTRRCFRHLANLAIPQRSCFVLTETGSQLIAVKQPDDQSLTDRPPRQSKVNGNSTEIAAADNVKKDTAATPCWNAPRRELCLSSEIIKRYLRPAPNQETILSVFQEEKWPARIDDPLPQLGGLVPARRLHDTIKGLNRNQQICRIHFRSDGSGKGVVWELV